MGRNFKKYFHEVKNEQEKIAYEQCSLLKREIITEKIKEFDFSNSLLSELNEKSKNDLDIEPVFLNYLQRREAFIKNLIQELSK